MILTSLILVFVSAVSLLIGGLFRDDLVLIYVSIAAALAAGVFLLVGAVRGARRRTPPRAAQATGSTGDTPTATWRGAGWEAGSDEDALLRGDDRPAADEAAVPSTTPAPPPAPPAAPPAGRPAPAAGKSPWAPPPPPTAPPPGRGGVTPPPPPA